MSRSENKLKHFIFRNKMLGTLSVFYFSLAKLFFTYSTVQYSVANSRVNIDKFRSDSAAIFLTNVIVVFIKMTKFQSLPGHF